MPHVITEKCLGKQNASCVNVCPVECIFLGKYQGQPFAIIDPGVCIDCGVCVPECPVGAIVGSEDEDPGAAHLNATLMQNLDKFQKGDDGGGASGVRSSPPKTPPPQEGENSPDEEDR